MEKTLLPSGLYDRLPPEARQETLLRSALLSTFESFGYRQVSPPLLEFEESLLAGRGATLAQQTFRVMDPISRRMMGMRPDMTMQVARIATSRLSNAPQPLRLSYAGAVLQVKGDPLRGERQFLQAGIELIGAATPAADAEVILVAIEALHNAGISGLSVDINLPGLLTALLEGDPAAARRDAIEQAVLRKDVAALAAFSLQRHDAIASLISKAGAVEKALPTLRSLALTGAAAHQLAYLEQMVTALRASLPGIALTIDALETRGFEYHHGISFSIFAEGVPSELGRGGRYMISDGKTLEATGATLYVGTVLRAAPPADVLMHVWVPFGTPPAATHGLRESGFVTLHALDAKDDTAEARRLGCTHIYTNGEAVKI